MRTLILFVMFCPLLQGCVGFAVLKQHTEVINNPVIASIRDSTYPAHNRDSSEATNALDYTSEWLQKHWGSPDCIKHVSGHSEEIWTYKFRLIWDGVVPFVILPIPLAVPVGKEQVSFILRDGRVVSSRITKPWMVGPVAGIGISPEGGGGAFATFLNLEAPY